MLRDSLESVDNAGFCKNTDFHAIRGWTEYDCISMNDFLGTTEERGEMIRYCEQIFQEKFHRGWHFSDAQKKLLTNIRKSVAIMDCVAGAGKTTILLAMAMWTIKKNREGGYQCLHYMAENQQLADDFHGRLIDLMGNTDGIFPLGSTMFDS